MSRPGWLRGFLRSSNRRLLSYPDFSLVLIDSLMDQKEFSRVSMESIEDNCRKK